MTEYTIESGIKPPRSRKANRIPDAVTAAFKQYEMAYRKAYGMPPLAFVYDRKTKFICIDGADGVSLKRLKQLTAMLTERAKQ